MKLKETVMSACAGVVISTATLNAPLANAEDSYVARLNDKGEYCAKVRIAQPGGYTSRKIKCRTLEEWEAAGYNVDTTAREVE